MAASQQAEAARARWAGMTAEERSAEGLRMNASRSMKARVRRIRDELSKTPPLPAEACDEFIAKLLETKPPLSAETHAKVASIFGTTAKG